MAQTLGSVAVGSIVKLNEGGSPVDFYVAAQNYESALNGAGRVLVVRKDVYDQRQWNSSNVNAWANCTMRSWLNSTYKGLLDADIQEAMGTTTYHYTPGDGNNTVTTRSDAVFLLSATELGQSKSWFNVEGSALPIANTLKVAYLNGSATYQWTRSPSTSGTNVAVFLSSDGGVVNSYCTYTYGSRPCFTLPSSLYVSDDGFVFQNTAPSTPANISVPPHVNEGGSVSVSWTASTDLEGNLSGYTLQRSVNGGGYVQVYRGAGTSFTDTAPSNADTLQYRVQAYDSEGLTSGWRTSSQVQVYEIPTLTVPQMVMQGQQATISWSAIEGADSYTLQRKSSADADWTQVYSGANLSYSETVGTWTSLQYRVQAVFDETPGGWATSDPIQIVSASALVISGQDGDLGTLVNDVPYSISSDQTSPTIDVTVEVNGGEYASFQATSGQTDKVGVLDLPTGTGSIVITATTEVSSSPVTVTRTWTYSKTAQAFPNSGSVATLTKEGNVVYPETLTEAVRAAMTPWGGNLSTALNLLKNAALFNRIKQPKYFEVTVSLSGKTEGHTIQLPEGGKMVEFYVSKLNYEEGLNGTGRVLVVRKNCYDQRAWDAGGVNAYATSDIDGWMNGEYKALFPEEIQTAMGTTKFYYTPGNGNNTVGTLERAVFALSAAELGKSESTFNAEGSALPIASTLQVAHLNGSATTQWTRSPATVLTNSAVCLFSGGDVNYNYCTFPYGSRPCFTLPSTFTATYYVDPQGTIHDQQEYTEAGDWLDVWGNAIPAVKIETGSYVGTGTYGQSNPTTLTFPFEPKVVFVVGSDSLAGQSLAMIHPSNFAFSVVNATNQIFSITWDGNSVSYFGTSDGRQFNQAGKTYCYVALG